MKVFTVHYRKVFFTVGWTMSALITVFIYFFPSEPEHRSMKTGLKLPKDFVLVTAASETYFGGLKELVGSMHFWEPSIKIAIYDLGLTETQLAEIETWCNVVVHDLPKYTPEHILRQPRKLGAWKPFVIYDSFDRYHSILYSDAGSNIRGPLSKIKEHLYKDGHFFVQGQDLDMTKKSHDGMYAFFNEAKQNFRNKPHFAGGLHGWLRGSEAEKEILYSYVLCAQKPECFEPAGSSVDNHRFDQSVLSIIIYTAPIKVTPHTELLAAERRQCNKNPFKPSDKLVFTARQTTRDYYSKICIKPRTS